MSSCCSWASFFCLFPFLLPLSLAISLSPSARVPVQNPIYINSSCSSKTYSRNNTYFTNLKTLLSSLSSRNASYSTGFQTATAGQAPVRVNGLFLCRGDVSQEVCRNCVAFSVNDTLEYCPNEREAVLYYNECMLRYSHRNILSTVTYNEDAISIMTNNANISETNQNQVDQFRDFLWSALNQAAIEASDSSRKFYTRKTSAPQSTLYLLVQCTPDLTRQDCLRCLKKSISGLPLYRIGGRLFYPSCNLRYEVYSFYNENATRTPPPSLPPASTPPQQQLELPPPPRISGKH
ncbi:cysteine-rich receptor-like protein kinase 4 [Capsella rubella]|uniref:cysteine-rich receptor-like protein kinase 4 n=1 Tax=Capsella rubella TaxID=81985 RepID=UPI000CD51101|nr:cysteine-rich receptor-like protein kinase 4 [Capsella rubella]